MKVLPSIRNPYTHISKGQKALKAFLQIDRLSENIYNQWVNSQLKTAVNVCLFGLFMLNPAKAQKPIPQEGITSQSKNTYDNVSCGTQDRQGNMWFATTGEGVYRLNGPSTANSGYKTYLTFTEKEGLCSNTVYAVMEDRAFNMWFGTMAGVCYYNGKTFTKLSITNSNPLAPFNQLAPQPVVNCLLQDKEGNIWFGTDEGAFIYDGKTVRHFLIKDKVKNENSIKLGHISKMIQDRAGDIWFTTWFNGVCRFNGRSIINYTPNKEVWFSGLLEDKKGNIWIGRRSKGACVYSPWADFKHGRMTFNNVQQGGIFDSCCICSIGEDQAGNIWFAAEYSDMNYRETRGGVWRYNVKEFKNYTILDGLHNMSVFSITVDRSGNIWFGTRGTGLSKYNVDASFTAVWVLTYFIN